MSWAVTVSFPPCYANNARPIGGTFLTNRTSSKKSLKLRASVFDYPLASKIMIRNLPYSTSESSLQKEFSSFGQIAEVKLVKDEATKKSKGYAFIQYTCQDDAMLALENMDHKIFDGRLIYVELSKLGKDAYGEYLRTTGPPKEQHSKEQDEVADCWY